MSFEDVNTKELRVAELSRFYQTTTLLQHIVCSPSTLFQLLLQCNRCKSWQGGWGKGQGKSKTGMKSLIIKVAGYLAMGGTLDGDQMLSTSAWQVKTNLV